MTEPEIVATNPYLERLKELPKVTELALEFSAVSTFSGAGGLDIGVAFAGFDIKFATDLERVFCETIERNFPHCLTLTIDAKELTGDKIRSLVGQDSFDLLCGGPPCQAFSILGQRNSFNDPRGKLVFEYIRLVKEIQPSSFLFENVPGLLTLNDGKDWSELLEYMKKETGYKIYHGLLNAADYGIPQIRNRVFIVGFQNAKVTFTFPKPTHSDPKSNPGIFDQKLLGWLPAKYALVGSEGLPNHRVRQHSDSVRNRYQKIPPGSRDKVDHTDRIHPERPSGTVLVGSKAGGGRPFIHPYEPRHLTVREAARLQSFPDWYVFEGPETWQYRAVGNAVPPLLAKSVGESIKVALTKTPEGA